MTSLKTILPADTNHILILLSQSIQAQKQCEEIWGEGFSKLENLSQNLGKILVFEGNIEKLLELFQKNALEEVAKKYNVFLEHCVIEWNLKKQDWERYSCRLVVMHCCAGAYLKLVNRKEIC